MTAPPSSSARHAATIALALCLAAGTAAAHGDAAAAEPAADLWWAWSRDPWVLVPLVLTALLYAAGSRRLARESSPAGRRARRAETVLFWSGWTALVVALASPLHPLGEVLFSAHMTQHEVLMLVAAPLLVLARPLPALMWALPPRWRHVVGAAARVRGVQGAWALATMPLVAWLVHAVALWIWHVPALFEATLRSDLVHTLQHAAFLGSALLFWWALVHGPRDLAGYGAAILYVFTTSVHSGALGALLTFARTVWYPSYERTASAWGLTALEDQQLGGLIMWVPAALAYLFAGLALTAGWLRESHERAQRLQRSRAGMAAGGTATTRTTR
ncbi:MAG TPA: cytochrome c oxidase assembly protein [Candidatus Limnocylindrales bacterium]|nr:cytochrome c oxidase assembly protein [Candidatus Limnocylindrales bacterium]